ncbi:hypothetical protein DMN91_010525 [Ooceraea biroi]|uniref:Uncharacterized protein n=1 Tax=Ooceraea biroi TaxID=2015173 RepID=A0A3L8D7K1_OOCBI|nr:hypothetical protein DMN91_010525 [Ooceraea biroi]
MERILGEVVNIYPIVSARAKLTSSRAVRDGLRMRIAPRNGGDDGGGDGNDDDSSSLVRALLAAMGFAATYLAYLDLFAH